MEVEAFVFDAAKAQEKEQAARDAKRGIVAKGKEGESGGAEGGEGAAAGKGKGRSQSQRRQGGGR